MPMLQINTLEIFKGTKLLDSQVIGAGIEPVKGSSIELTIKAISDQDFDKIGFFLNYDGDIDWDTDKANTLPVDWVKGTVWAAEARTVSVTNFPSKKQLYIGIQRNTPATAAPSTGEWSIIKIYGKLLDAVGGPIRVWIEGRVL